MSPTNSLVFLVIFGIWIGGTIGICHLQSPVELQPSSPFPTYSYEIFCTTFPDEVDCSTHYGRTMRRFTSKTAPPEIRSLCEQFSQISELLIENTQLESMAPNCLDDFPHLTAIHLSRNKIRRIVGNVFSNKKRLLLLDLSFNSILEIQEDSFAGNKNLTYLFLNDNNITSLNVAVFAGLANLETLKLTNNPINHVSPTTRGPGSIWWGRNNRNLARIFLRNTTLDLINCRHIISEYGIVISELDMGQNMVTKISTTTFRQLLSLEILDLSYNLIEYIEDGSLGKHGNLIKLYLNNNRIRNLTDSVFSSLLSLSYLDLSNNPIARISENTVGKLPLSELYLRNLSLISDNFRLPKYEKLQKLDISHNNMTNIDRVLPVGSKNLSLLDLSYNNISKFQTTLSMTVAHLDMNHNNLTEINSMMLSNRKALTLLDLSYNSITLLDGNSLENDTELVALFLQRNKLENIPATLLKDTINLIHLDLSGNQIESLFESTFETSKNLLVLNLSGNRLKSLGKLHFYPLKHLEKLYLQSNQLREIEGVQYLESLKEIALTNNLWKCENFLGAFETLDKFGTELANDSDIHFVHHVRHISCDYEDMIVPIVEEEVEKEEVGNSTVTAFSAPDSPVQENSTSKLILLLVIGNVATLVSLCALCVYFGLKIRKKKTLGYLEQYQLVDC